MRKQKKRIRATAAVMVCCLLSGGVFTGAGISTVQAEGEGGQNGVRLSPSYPGIMGSGTILPIMGQLQTECRIPLS